MTQWQHGKLELCWYQREDDIAGIVWSIDPIHCSAFVNNLGGEYRISTYGLRGLSESEHDSLRAHLDTLAEVTT